MLSQQEKEIIRSTVPILEEKGVEITSRFYQNMFAAHPELLNIFNHTNQKTKAQPHSLAESLYLYAKHIDDLSSVKNYTMQIAHKHRSVGVIEEQYPIIGKYLIGAMCEILELTTDSPVIQAWMKAYQELAQLFIFTEKELYQQADRLISDQFIEMELFRKVDECEHIASFYLRPKNSGQFTARFLPGQYISVKVDVPGYSHSMIRQYSLSEAPGNSHYRITVKKEVSESGLPAGIVSTYLHEQLKEGDSILVSAPAGVFTLDQSKETPIVLIAGGIGMTPLLSMMKTVTKEQPEREVHFWHAVRNGSHHAYGDELRSIEQNSKMATYHVLYENPTEKDRQEGRYDLEGRIDLPLLRKMIRPEADYYICGPSAFMDAMKRQLESLGVSQERIHSETFGPSCFSSESTNKRESESMNN